MDSEPGHTRQLVMRYVEAWLREQETRGLSPATVRRRAVSMRSWARWCAAQGRDSLTATEDDVLGWLRQLPSQATRHCYVADLRAFYRWADRRGLLPANSPTEDLPPVPDTHRRARPLDPARVAMAVGAADPDTRLMLMLGTYMGLRRSEIAALRGADVDSALGAVEVRGKGGRVRLVPIHPHVAPELSLRPGRGYLFPGRDGGHVHPQTVGRRLASALRRAGLDGAVGHQTRHTAATMLLRSGARIEVVAEILGHRRIDTTRQYAALADDAPARAMAKLRLA